MKKFDYKQILPHAVAVLIFIAISFLYFSPEIFEGKTVLGHDSRTGMGQDLRDYRATHGETSWWSDAMFSGMPSYQMTMAYDSTLFLIKVRNVLGLFLPVPVGYVFIMLLGFYIMLLVFGARTDVAILGAIGYAFSSYFFIIIGAGHIFKLITLAYIPPTIAGIALAYKGKYWAGGIMTACFLALQILSNHVQMSYYFIFVILAYAIYEFVENIKNKTLPKFFKASAVLMFAAIIAVSLNASNLYHTWQYGKGTMRGGTELTHDSPNQTKDGLNRDYMVRWSYGIGETWSLLIPNAKGGASQYLGNNTGAMNDVAPQWKQAIAQQNAYWGDQPGTSGPVYAGAIFCLFFVMSILILRSKLKWAMLAVFVLTVMLSWGQNFMWLTNFFADYVPMYSKFRAVSSILVVVEFIIPLMASLMIIEIIRKPEIIKENKTKIYISLGITGGLSLLFALIPDLFFNFLSSAESDAFYAQAKENPQVLQFIDALESARKGIFSTDAWRSFGFIAGAGILMYLYSKKILKKSYIFVGALALLCLIDMWGVNKRYLGAKNFIPASNAKNLATFFPKSPADIEILKDTDLSYRVFNNTVDVFNDASTSFYHKSVGGYHAAKLSRYQDIIEYRLTPERQRLAQARNSNDLLEILQTTPTFNMLNTRYFILAGQGGQPTAFRNPYAFGNAWFVDTIKWVANADQEIAALADINPATTAAIDKRFENILQNKTIAKDSASNIVLTEYDLNILRYKSTSSKDGLVVFSEVYYTPGWEATIDGAAVDIVRVNYILRGLYVPAGEHEIVFTFNPKSVSTTEKVAFAAMIVLLLAAVGYFVWRNKKTKED